MSRTNYSFPHVTSYEGPDVAFHPSIPVTGGTVPAEFNSGKLLVVEGRISDTPAANPTLTLRDEISMVVLEVRVNVTGAGQANLYIRNDYIVSMRIALCVNASFLNALMSRADSRPRESSHHHCRCWRDLPTDCEERGVKVRVDIQRRVLSTVRIHERRRRHKVQGVQRPGLVRGLLLRLPAPG